MTTAAIQGRLLFEGGVYCNVIMIATAIIQKLRSCTVQIVLFVIYYSVSSYTKFFSKLSSLAIEFPHD